MRLGDEAHHAEEGEQACAEDTVRTIEALREVPRRVERAQAEQDAHEAEDELAEAVEDQPVAERCHLGAAQRHDHEGEVRHTGDGKQPRPPALRREREGDGRQRQRRQDEREGHRHSLRAFKRAVSSDENSRLMWLMMMPMTKMPTNRSSSTPISTRKGIASSSVRPMTKMPFSRIR